MKRGIINNVAIFVMVFAVLGFIVSLIDLNYGVMDASSSGFFVESVRWYGDSANASCRSAPYVTDFHVFSNEIVPNHEGYLIYREGNKTAGSLVGNYATFIVVHTKQFDTVVTSLSENPSKGVYTAGEKVEVNVTICDPDQKWMRGDLEIFCDGAVPYWDTIVNAFDGPGNPPAYEWNAVGTSCTSRKFRTEIYNATNDLVSEFTEDSSFTVI